MLLKLLYDNALGAASPNYTENLDQKVTAYFHDLADQYAADSVINNGNGYPPELVFDLEPEEFGEVVLAIGSGLSLINEQFKAKTSQSHDVRAACSLMPVARTGDEITYLVEFFDMPTTIKKPVDMDVPCRGIW